MALIFLPPNMQDTSKYNWTNQCILQTTIHSQDQCRSKVDSHKWTQPKTCHMTPHRKPHHRIRTESSSNSTSNPQLPLQSSQHTPTTSHRTKNTGVPPPYNPRQNGRHRPTIKLPLLHRPPPLNPNLQHHEPARELLPEILSTTR